MVTGAASSSEATDVLGQPGIGDTRGYRRSEVGLIPDDWEVSQLGEIAEIQRGASPRPIDNPRWFDKSSSTGWLRISDVTRAGKYLYETSQNLSAAGIANSRFVEAGSLVMSICATVGRPILTKKDVCIHDGFVVFSDLRADPEFIYYALLGIQDRWSEYGQTGSQMNLNTGIVKAAHIPLPPEDEQRAIANVLSDVDELLQGLQARIRKAKGVRDATKQDLLSRRIRMPRFTENWRRTTLSSLFALLPTASKPRSDLSSKGQVYYVHYGDIHTRWENHLDFSSSSIPCIDAEKVKGVEQLREGDLIVVDASEDKEGVGKCVEVCGLKGQPAVAGLHTFLLRSRDNEIAARFGGYLMEIPEVRRAVQRVATGLKVFGLSKTEIQDIEIPLPPLPEQEAMAEVLYDMDADVASLETKLEKVGALKTGVLQELLTGRTRLLHPQGETPAPQ